MIAGSERWEVVTNQALWLFVNDEAREKLTELEHSHKVNASFYQLENDKNKE